MHFESIAPLAQRDYNMCFLHTDPYLPTHICADYRDTYDPDYHENTREQYHHTLTKIIYANTGSLLLEFPHQTYRLEAGSAAVFSMPTVLSLRMPPHTPRWECLSFIIQNGEWHHHVHAIHGTHGPIIAIPQNDPVLDSFIDLYAAVRDHALRDAEECADKLYHIFMQLRRLAIPQKHLLPQPLTEVLAFMSKHYTEPLTLAQLAEVAGLSRTYFCAIFRQYLGLAPLHYLTRVRLQQSLVLLAETELKLAEIARCCGFVDASHLGKTFRTILHCAPMEYRASKILPKDYQPLL